MRKYLLLSCLFVVFTSLVLGKEYPIKKPTNPSRVENLKGMTAACQIGSTVTEISLNNVRTYVHMDGILWSSNGTGAAYEIPKNSDKSSICAGSIWIGGTDVNGQLKFTGLKYL